MNREKRQLVHEYAELFGCESEVRNQCCESGSGWIPNFFLDPELFIIQAKMRRKKQIMLIKMLLLFYLDCTENSVECVLLNVKAVDRFFFLTDWKVFSETYLTGTYLFKIIEVGSEIFHSGFTIHCKKYRQGKRQKYPLLHLSSVAVAVLGFLLASSAKRFEGSGIIYRSKKLHYFLNCKP